MNKIDRFTFFLILAAMGLCVFNTWQKTHVSLSIVERLGYTDILIAVFMNGLVFGLGLIALILTLMVRRRT